MRRTGFEPVSSGRNPRLQNEDGYHFRHRRLQKHPQGGGIKVTRFEALVRPTAVGLGTLYKFWESVSPLSPF